MTGWARWSGSTTARTTWSSIGSWDPFQSSKPTISSYVYLKLTLLTLLYNNSLVYHSDKVGKEIITKYASNIDNKGVFYTDSNGRDMLERKINYRPTWKVKLEEPISGNYYPVTAKISIKDEKSRLSALTDRAQGGSSLKDGEIELMVSDEFSRSALVWIKIEYYLASIRKK